MFLLARLDSFLFRSPVLAHFWMRRCFRTSVASSQSSIGIGSQSSYAQSNERGGPDDTVGLSPRARPWERTITETHFTERLPLFVPLPAAEVAFALVLGAGVCFRPLSISETVCRRSSLALRVCFSVARISFFEQEVSSSSIFSRALPGMVLMLFLLPRRCFFSYSSTGTGVESWYFQSNPSGGPPIAVGLSPMARAWFRISTAPNFTLELADSSDDDVSGDSVPDDDDDFFADDPGLGTVKDGEVKNAEEVVATMLVERFAPALYFVALIQGCYVSAEL